jgi:hypothetical protein
MTRLTAVLIKLADEDGTLILSTYTAYPGCVGFYIGTMEETPSGYERPRDLVSSKPVYLLPAHALLAARMTVDEVKALV